MYQVCTRFEIIANYNENFSPVKTEIFSLKHFKKTAMFVLQTPFNAMSFFCLRKQICPFFM